MTQNSTTFRARSGVQTANEGKRNSTHPEDGVVDALALEDVVEGVGVDAAVCAVEEAAHGDWGTVG
jgi:hypothetical protein